MLNFDLKSTYN